MHRPTRSVLGLIVLLGISVPTHAQEPGPASPSEIDVYLVTYGPGQVYWERFGHNAIWIRDPAGSIDAMFNYGVFDFDQDDFLVRFIQGRMLYRLEAQDPEQSLHAYRAANRSIWIQELNLTHPQRVALRDFLVWNALPENRDYLYDYYLDNCSTRLRDALDDALGGVIRAHTESRETGTTFRFHTQRLTTANVLYYTGLLVGLGTPVDRPINAWEEMFIPMSIRDRVREITVLGEHGDEVPLVKSEVLYFETTAPAPAAAPPRWLIWYLIAGVALAVALALPALASGVAARWSLAVAGGAWMLLVGLVGLVLAGLWLATDHATSYWNENLFYLTPIALPAAIVLPLAVFGVRWAQKPARWFGAAVGVSSVLGFLLQIAPGFDQVNGQLIALVLPANVVLGCVAWRRFHASGLARARRPVKEETMRTPTLLSATLASVLAISIPACSPPASRSEAELCAQRLATFDTLDYDAFSNQKWERFAESHAANIVVTWPDGRETVGLDPHIEDLKTMFVYAPNTSIKEHPIRICQGDYTAVVGVMTGTFSAPMPTANGGSIPPTGESFRLMMTTVGHWEGSTMAREWLFWDNQAFMRQIGLAP